MTFDVRTYQRDFQRRKRAARLAQANQGCTRCAAKVGPGVCGGRLDVHLDALGRTVVVCPWCTRKRAGICRDCSAPVEGSVGKALRCARHKQDARDMQIRRSNDNHREERARSARKSLRADPARREKKAEYKRAWRKANRDKVRAQKRRAALRQPDRVRDYMKEYREAYREHYRRIARERYHRLHPDRPSPVCIDCGATIPYEPPGAPMRRCDNCVYPSERRRREAVRASRAGRVHDIRPTRITRPDGIKYATTGQRLCLGDDCRVVLTGRKKKCSRCKAQDTVRAEELLAARRGRGRRTDLTERVA